MLRVLRLLCIVFICLPADVAAQDSLATIQGVVRGQDGNTLPNANIIIISPKTSFTGVAADVDGNYSFMFPAPNTLVFRVTFTGSKPQTITLDIQPGQTYTQNIKLDNNTLIGVDVVDKQRNTTMTRIDPTVQDFIPMPSDDISVLLSRGGAIVRNELSSGYSVRGGNFDENLIYVNDIEVYRPFLVRSGQQEGLSFPNSDMVQSLNFSAGGFEAKYGDKLSSVLDITYKKPTEFGGSFRGSLLGGALHLEGSSKDNRFRHVTGVRYKANSYILGSLDTQGDYKPTFFDFQTYLTYYLTDQWELNFLGHVSQNKYRFIPGTRETEFGTVNEALKLTVYFDGQEVDEFLTMTGAFSLSRRSADDKTLIKFIGSAFQTFESETYDILGQYWLDELERDLGSEDFGDVAFNRGVGTFLNHGRNYLQARVLNLAHKGFHEHGNGGNQYLSWGVKVQREDIQDQLSEWTMLDSAGYSVPQAPQGIILLQDVVKADINLGSNRLTGYVQNNWSWYQPSRNTPGDSASIDLILGIRGHYWDYNNQFVYSPRANLAVRPRWYKEIIRTDSTGTPTDTTKQLRDYVFRFSTGFYHQPPFYRELRDFDGILNPNIRAQRSLHAVLGMDHEFKMWKRPFKFVTEAYYKHMWDLIPYEQDNVRIRYFATNNSKGYAYGLDMRLNGEFIKGIESWVSASYLKTEEDISDDFYYDYFNAQGEKIIPGFSFDQEAVDSVRYEPGYIPRNQDQRFAFSLFFQDEMPKWPTFKVHLNLLFATGVPFGPPTRERYKDILRSPSYRRVDIGFSKELIGPTKKWRNEDSKWRNVERMWVSLEVFNLFGISNTTNYLWIKDVTNRQYAIPNFLTARRLNVKIAMKF